MSDFDPGEGWREIPEGYYEPGEVLSLNTGKGAIRRWVREAPLPPLPTEPYTVIRVTWNYGPSSTDVLTLVGGRWDDCTAGNLRRNITAFEVLAEPRTVIDQRVSGSLTLALAEQRKQTAKAVLDRMREVFNDTRDGRTLNETLTIVADEFGVHE